VLAGKPPPSVFVCWKALVLTSALNSMIPGRVAELVKPVFLNEHAQVPLGAGFAALFLERVLDVAILFGLALAAAGMTFVHCDWKLAGSVFAGLLGLVGLLPLFEARLQKLGGLIPLKRARAFYADSLSHAAATVRGGRIVPAFLLGVAGWLAPIAGAYLFLRLASPVPIGFAGALSLFVVTAFSFLIPVLPAGIGVYEAGAVFVLQFYAISPEQALALGMVLHTGNTLTVVLGGGFVMIRDHIGIGAFVRRLKASKYDLAGSKWHG